VKIRDQRKPQNHRRSRDVRVQHGVRRRLRQRSSTPSRTPIAASGSPIQPSASEQSVTPSWTAGRKSSRSCCRLRTARAPGTPGSQHPLHLRVANRHQRKLRSHKKSVGQNQQGHRDNLRARAIRASGCENSTSSTPTKTDQVPSPLPKQRRSPVGTLVDVYEKRDQVWDLNQLWVAVPADGNGVPPNPCYLICNAQSYAGRLGRMGPPGKGEGIAPGICEGLVLNIAEGRRGLISVGSGSQVDIFPQELTDGKQCPVGSGKEGNNQFWLFTDENMTPFPCPYSV
jgi:hypothetical protein